MSYDPERDARVCHAAVRQFRAENALERGPVWGLLTKEEQSWWVRSAQRARMGMLPREIFEAWADDLSHEGWVFGSELSHEKRTHPVLTDWFSLPESVQRQYVILQMNSVGLNLPMTGVLPGKPATRSMCRVRHLV